MMNKTLFALIISGLLLASDIALAKPGSGISVNRPDSRTLATQRKVDELYVDGEYERAFFIYRNELAPIGDKYAQYMIGYLYHTGKGVIENHVAASAWYQLAAERGTREFIVVRDQLNRSMTSEQIRDSESLYQELRMQFSDLAVLMAAIKRDHSKLQQKTGSRIHSDASPVAVIDVRRGRTLSGSDYHRSIHDQLVDGLTRLKQLGDFEALDTNPENLNVSELERQVSRAPTTRRVSHRYSGRAPGFPEILQVAADPSPDRRGTTSESS